MRMTTQLIKLKSSGTAGKSVEYLNLAKLGIVTIENLGCCSKLQVLDLGENKIQEISDVEICQQLWKLDLSNNGLRNLDGLRNFMVLGSVNLSNNLLTWNELAKLRHLHILDFKVFGNPKLEKDSFYRIHVIDCLPNIWMLDGKMITSHERLQVEHFFHESAIDNLPVRHKLPKEIHFPTAVQNISKKGVYGVRATHLLSRFPVDVKQNVELDKRRLNYLAYNAQEILILENKYGSRNIKIVNYCQTFLEDILEARQDEGQQCDALFLLLLGSLEFLLPAQVILETLEALNLHQIRKMFTIDLFLLPRDIRCTVVSIYLNAIKIDKDEDVEGGLYDRLFLCLFHSVTELFKLPLTEKPPLAAGRVASTQFSSLYKEYKFLLAAEVIHLLFLSASFYDLIECKDFELMNLFFAATINQKILADIIHLAEKQNYQKESNDTMENTFKNSMQKMIEKRINKKLHNLSAEVPKLSACEYVLSTVKPLSNKSQFKPVIMADYHYQGKSSPDNNVQAFNMNPKRMSSASKMFPRLGDLVLSGPQTLGKIVSLPEPFNAMVCFDGIPGPNGAIVKRIKDTKRHYKFINMKNMEWLESSNFWKPKGSTGDFLYTSGVMRKSLDVVDAYTHSLFGYSSSHTPFSRTVSLTLKTPQRDFEVNVYPPERCLSASFTIKNNQKNVSESKQSSMEVHSAMEELLESDESKMQGQTPSPEESKDSTKISPTQDGICWDDDDNVGKMKNQELEIVDDSKSNVSQVNSWQDEKECLDKDILMPLSSLVSFNSMYTADQEEAVSIKSVVDLKPPDSQGKRNSQKKQMQNLSSFSKHAAKSGCEMSRDLDSYTYQFVAMKNVDCSLKTSLFNLTGDAYFERKESDNASSKLLLPAFSPALGNRRPYQVQIANYWLGRGRNLFKEQRKKQQQLRHQLYIPGWKQDMPKKFQQQVCEIIPRDQCLVDFSFKPVIENVNILYENCNKLYPCPSSSSPSPPIFKKRMNLSSTGN